MKLKAKKNFYSGEAGSAGPGARGRGGRQRRDRRGEWAQGRQAGVGRNALKEILSKFNYKNDFYIYKNDKLNIIYFRKGFAFATTSTDLRDPRPPFGLQKICCLYPGYGDHADQGGRGKDDDYHRTERR